MSNTKSSVPIRRQQATRYSRCPTKSTLPATRTAQKRSLNRSEPALELYHGDCLEIMPTMAGESVDLVLADLPYGTTACAWDSVIPLDRMWREIRRVGKPDCVFVFTAQQPFAWALCASNPRYLRHELIWEKPNGTNPFQAKIMPMKRHENVLVFCRRKPTYNPQMVEGSVYRWNSKRSKGEAGGIDRLLSEPIANPGVRYPSSVLRFKQERGLHPTQKPVALMEWLIRTYSNTGARVLDIAMGSGTTGIAAMNAGRAFTGIEIDDTYFRMSQHRMGQDNQRSAAR